MINKRLSKKWQPENLDQLIKEHGGGRHSGERFGNLIVLHIHNKKSNQRRKVDCICRCGRIVTKNWDDVLNYRDRICGYEECKWTQEAWEKMDTENNLAAVIDEIKPKWICHRPDEVCAISAICNICCAECSKEKCYKRCKNSPEKCGGSERRDHESEA
nr:MAG TPA: hypothetical protein [Caudoviricetes sp.]